MKVKIILNGSITVFLTMIFTVILALVCILLENVRVSSASSKAEGITYMGLDSCFAEYGKELFDEYGVMYIWSEEQSISQRLNSLIKYNCNNDVKDIYGLNLESMNINGVCSAIDNGGENFENQVYQYMKLKLGEDAVNGLKNRIKDKIGILNESEKITAVYDKISECSKEFEEAEKSVQNVAGLIGKIDNNPNNAVIGIINSNDKNEADERYHEYEKWSENTLTILNEIKKDVSDFAEKSKDAYDSAENIRKYITDSEEGMDAEIYQLLKSEVDSICDKFNDNDGYGMQSCGMVAEYAETEINQLNEKLIKYSEAEFNDEQLEKDIVERTEKLDLSGLKLNIDLTDIEDKNKESVLDKVNDMLNGGLLNLIVEETDKISSEVISNDEQLSDEMEEFTGDDSSVRKLVFGQYILDCLKYYTNTDEKTRLRYEIEYVISGRNEDKDNLVNVAEKIIAIRSGFNMISIFKDPSKEKETYAMAVSVAGVTVMPLVIKAVQIGIISGWALAESVADVRNLLSGKKVAIIKNSKQWNLSLDRIMDIKNVSKEDDDEGGLGYDDYLRFLLGIQDYSEQIKRTMNIIQLNMQKQYNKDFKFSECIGELSVECMYSVKKLFNKFAPSFITGDKYDIRIEQTYRY